MEKLIFKHHPQEYYSRSIFCNEKQTDEQQLLNTYSGTDICIEVYSDSGMKTPTIYKSKLKNGIEKPSSIDDFEFKMISI